MRLYASLLMPVLLVFGLAINFSTTSEYYSSEAQVGTHGDIPPHQGTRGPRG